MRVHHSRHAPKLGQHAVGYLAIQEQAPRMASVYRSGALLGLSSRLAKKDLVLKHSNDEHACALYAYDHRGDGINYHYDTCGCEMGASYAIIIGLIVMLGCMLGGFAAMGGHIMVLWQPWEFVIILGTSLGTFIVLYGLYGVAMAFFSPASTGLIPETLPADELQRANGLMGMTRSVTAVAGGAVGGLLVSAIGPGSAIAVDAVTFAVSALALALMHVGAAAVGEREPFAHELAVGWREVRSRRWVWMSILNASLFLMLYVAPFEVLGPIVSLESLGGPVAWGLISASFAAGMAVGGLGMMLIRLRRPMVVASAILLVTSVSPLLLAHAAPVAVICAAYFVEGVAVGVWITTWETALQREISARVLSRVSAWDWMGSLAGMPIGFALTGPLLALVGERAVLYGTAAVALVLTIWLLAVADLRHIGSTDSTAVVPTEA